MLLLLLLLLLLFLRVEAVSAVNFKGVGENGAAAFIQRTVVGRDAT